MPAWRMTRCCARCTPKRICGLLPSDFGCSSFSTGEAQLATHSFAGNGDGTGDLIGVRQRLDHLVELGVDAIWLSPFYRSPMADGGYDVADPCDVDPLFGTLADFDALLAGAHERGIRVTIDIVPNHFSDQHVWFQEALAAPPGSRERARFI